MYEIIHSINFSAIESKPTQPQLAKMQSEGE
jgi:hypothetical protein